MISWDDFEAHTTGTELAGANLQPIIGTQWTTFKLSPSTDPVEISTTQKYAGSKSVYILWDSEGVNSFGWAGQGPYPELYYTFMSRQDIMLETSIVNDNRKLAFLYGASTLNHIPFIPGSGSSYGTYNNDSTAQPNYSGTNNLASDSTYGTGHPITYADTDKRWVRFAYHIKNNTSPTCTIGVDCDGVNTYWIDDVLRFHRTDYRHTNSNDTGWRDFRLGMMWNRNNGGQRQAWFDDLYIATSQARVELCAGSTWASAGKCEIQIPTAWTPSSITATVNTGAFSESDAAYLYVVDSNGDANPLGVEVEIGGSGGTDTTPPVLSLLAPSGTLAAGTTSTTLSFVTNEAALCRYSTSPGTAYASMTNNFSTALSQSHSATVSGLENGGSYTYYVRCIDGSGNANTSDATISFSVASSAGTAGVLSWEYSTYSADRSDGRIPINIIRTGGSTGTVTAQWSSNGQTATHNVDYYGNDSVTVTFADGVTSVPINTYGGGENGIEMIANGATDDRYFQMILSNPTGGATIGTTLATVIINGQPVVMGLRISVGAMPVGVGSTKITPIQ